MFTALMGWGADILTMVMENPPLLVAFTLGFGFTAIALIKSLRS